MGVFEMVVLIVLIVAVSISRVAKHRIDAKAAGKLPDPTGELQGLRHQVVSLDARIQTLERLVTDPSRRLSDEIEALRR